MLGHLVSLDIATKRAVHCIASGFCVLHNKASRICSQSCLCSTPDLRSFHMGIALMTLFSTQRFLRRVQRTLAPLSTAVMQARLHTPHLTKDLCEPVANGMANWVASSSPRSPRGNWPFTTTPPVRPAQPPVNPGLSHRLRSARTGEHATAWAAPHTVSKGMGQGSRNTTRVLRSAAGHGVGRLIIAGRMADVCAELDRMAASEAMGH